jgi:molybdate-binding protein
VQVARVGDQVIGVPVSTAPYFLPEADGMIAGTAKGRTKLTVFSQEDRFAKRLVLAGCDPAIGLLAGMVERNTGVVVIPAPAASRQALDWLRDGKVHIAGTHLKDARTGEFNVPILAREYPDEDFVVVTFAAWEEGFVVAHGNPKGVKSAADLARRGVRFVNRESGSGSRALLDGMLREAGVGRDKVAGYDRVAYGHLAAAHAVSLDEGDCCIATQSAARTFGLDFVALQSERYDFVLRRSAMELPEVRHFLEVLQRADLRRKLEVLAGYETGRTGAVIA